MSPIVPRYQSRVQTAPLPGVRVGTGTPQGAFGVGSAVDLSAPVQLLSGIVDRQRQDADQIKLQDRDTQLANLHTDVETQVTQLKGLDALGARTAAEEAWKKGLAQIDGSDDNASDQVKNAFHLRAQTYWSRLYGTVEAHTAQQMQVHDAQSTDAALSNRVQGAAKDPSLAPQLAAETSALVTDYGRRQGWDAEQLGAERTKRVSAVHVAALDRLLSSGADRDAQKYYDLHRAEIGGEDAVRVEKALESSSILGEGQRQSDLIIRTQDITRAAAYERARTIEDPKVREATERNLDTEFRRRDQADQDTQQARFSSASNYAEQGRRPPGNVWAGLTLQERSAIDSRIRQVVSRDPVSTDPTTYYSMMKIAATNPEKFVKVDLLRSRSLLSNSDFESMVRLQTGMMKSDPEAQAKLTGYRTTKEIVDGVADAIHLKDPKVIDLYHQAVEQRIGALQVAKGRPATRPEVQEIADDLATQGVVEGTGVLGFFQTKQRVFQATPGQRLILDITDVPRGDQQTIREQLRQSGLPATDDAVRAKYSEFITENRVGTAPRQPEKEGSWHMAGRTLVDLAKFGASLHAPAPTAHGVVEALSQFAGAATKGGPATAFLDGRGRAAGGPPSSQKPALSGTAESRPGAASPAAPSSAPAGPLVPERSSDRPAVYTAPDVKNAIVDLREGRITTLRIPGETEDLAERERFLTEFLRLRHSLTAGGNADNASIVVNAKYDLSRVQAIRRGEIQPSSLRNFLKE